MPDEVIVRTHVLLIPGLLALAAILAHNTGVDHAIAGWFFDEVSGGFPARGSAILETLGHRLANAMVVALFMLLVLGGMVATWWQPLHGYRRLLLTTAGAMAAGPTVVVGLKSVTTPRCPWSLVRYGGLEQAPHFWFTMPANAGECFPGGHAAGGFALVAIYFAGKVSGNRALERSGLLLTLVAGIGFSLVRIAQGAHFLSHNLWSAALCWGFAALVFRQSFSADAHPLRVREPPVGPC